MKQRAARAVACAAIAATLALPAPIAAAETSDAERRHQQDRAACLLEAGVQDLNVCLREAAAARAEERRAGADGADRSDAATLERNAFARCERLPADHRLACERRLRGEGSVQGSVIEGGIVRELVLPDPAKP